MDKLQELKVINEDGTLSVINIITILTKPEDDTKFILYTYDTEDEDISIYASIIKETEEDIVLENINSKEDWEIVQKAIETLKETGGINE